MLFKRYYYFFFKKQVGEELICILHLYYFLLKFTPDPVAKEILVKSSVVLAGSVLLWLSPCYRAGWGRCPPHTESVPWGWGGREANITELPFPWNHRELPGRLCPQGMSGRWTHV